MRRFGAYIDETGDRGLGTNSSPIFGMAAIVIRETDLPSLREATAQLRSDFGVPKDSTMNVTFTVFNNGSTRLESVTVSDDMIPGPITCTPRQRSVAIFACVAGCSHIR